MDVYQIIHHVVNDHHFKDEGLFYRFYADEDVEDNGRGPALSRYLLKTSWYREYRETARAALHLHGLLKTTGGSLIDDRPWHLTMYKQCIVANQFVAWLVQTGG